MQHATPVVALTRSVQPLPEERELAIIPGGRSRLLKAGETLFREGDQRVRIYVVESGWLKLTCALRDGKRQIVGFPTRGSILGFETPEDYLHDCTALTMAAVHAFPVSAIVSLCRDPAFREPFLRQLGMQLGAAQTQLALVGGQSAAQKTAAFLTSMAGRCIDRDSAFSLPMRRSDIGEFLGLRLETVSRMFGAFRDHGWISMPAIYRCRITNFRALAALASGARTMKSFPRPGHMIAQGENLA